MLEVIGYLAKGKLILLYARFFGGNVLHCFVLWLLMLRYHYVLELAREPLGQVFLGCNFDGLMYCSSVQISISRCIECSSCYYCHSLVVEVAKSVLLGDSLVNIPC